MKKKYFFFNASLSTIRQQLNLVKRNNTPAELEHFENQLTLQELEECFFKSKTSKELIPTLTSLLAKRWARIRGSTMCYTSKPYNIVNQLCFEVAKTLSPSIQTQEDIKALKPFSGPYFLLMPSLSNYEDVYGENIHKLGLHELVLSTKERVFIPLEQCLYQASISAEGKFRHMVTIDNQYPELTKKEINRICKHSKPTKEYYEAVIALNKQRILGDDLGGKLNQLTIALRSGGSHSSTGSGTELNAGAAANLGILEFHNYWKLLPANQKSAIFEETPDLKDIVERLFRPQDANFREVRYCVELLADKLDPIIEKFNRQPKLENLKNQLVSKTTAFNEAMKNGDNLVIGHNTKLPNVLHLIYKQPQDKQKEIFKHSTYSNALEYALAYSRTSLNAFELSNEIKKEIIKSAVNQTPIFIFSAAKAEKKVIDLLLSWGANLELQDQNNNTALNMAARKRHTNTAHYLLEKGANVDNKGEKNNTPLNSAVENNHIEMAELLLTFNANINARNEQGLNALDIAMVNNFKHISDLILLKIVTLPIDQQLESLLNIPEGPYLNALLYVAEKNLTLFETVLEKVFQITDNILKHTLLTTCSEKEGSPLITAVKLGKTQSVRKLLEAKVNIEVTDSYKDTALHWAAYYGHLDIVKLLVAEGANLEAKGYNNHTALTWAVSKGHKAVTEFLLEQKADVGVRNNSQHNAVELALTSDLLYPILMHLLTLPISKQVDCLINTADGPYPNVLFYAASRPEGSLFFETLINTALQLPSPLKEDLLNSSNQNEDSLLICAARMGQTETVRKLLGAGAKFNYRNQLKNSALHEAALNGHLNTVKLLLEAGAELETKGNFDETALHCAIRSHNTDTVVFLLQKNACLFAPNEQGLNPFELALNFHRTVANSILMHIVSLSIDEQRMVLSFLNIPDQNILFYILRKHPQLFNSILDKVLQRSDKQWMIRAVEKDNETLLMLAANLGKADSICKLHDAGLDINALNDFQETALFYAIRQEDLHTVQLLIERGASLGIKNKDGNNVLNSAIIQRKWEIAKFLFQKNANINIQNHQGLNAFDLAIKSQNQELIDDLLEFLIGLPQDSQAQCLINVKDGRYANVLFYAIEENLLWLETLFLKRSDILKLSLLNRVNQKGESLLIKAIQLNKIPLAEGLLEAGVNINAEDNEKNTALDWAINSNNDEISISLIKKGANIMTLGKSAREQVKQHPTLKETLLNAILKLPLQQRIDCLLNTTCDKDSNFLCYFTENRPHRLTSLFSHETKNSNINLGIHLGIHLRGIIEQYQKMKVKARFNSNYQPAVIKVEALIKACTNAIVSYYDTISDDKPEKLLRFKNSCKHAIEAARPTLKQYRELDKMLGKFLLAILTLPISLPLYVCGFFSFKTKSEELLDKLNKDLNTLQICHWS